VSERDGDVALSWAEVEHAGAIGWARHIRARAAGRREVIPLKSDAQRWSGDILGALGEAAVARATGDAWDEVVGRPDRGAPDVGPWHVRTRPDPREGLPIHEYDTDTEPFVLVVLLGLPWFRVVGWCYAGEAKSDEFWRPNMPLPAWIVPQRILRPLDKLAEYEARP
jgi:hypothetical protein